MLEECSSSTEKKRKEGKNIIFIAFLTPKFTSDNTLPSHKNLLSPFFFLLHSIFCVCLPLFLPLHLCSSSYSILNKRFIVNEEVSGLGWEGENVFFLFSLLKQHHRVPAESLLLCLIIIATMHVNFAFIIFNFGWDCDRTLWIAQKWNFALISHYLSGGRRVRVGMMMIKEIL